MNDLPVRLDNPVNQRQVLKGVIYQVLSIFIIVGLTSIDGFTWFSVAVAIVCSFVIFYLISFDEEVVKRPKLIEIKDVGIVAKKRYSNSYVEVAWADIFALSLCRSALNGDKNGKSNNYLWLDKKKNLTLSNEIAIEVRNKYRQVLGKDPPTYNEAQRWSKE